MATITYFEPQWVGNGNLTAPQPGLWNPAQGAVWRRGAILTLQTTGTLTYPAPTGALATATGPAASAVTFGSSAVSGAPGGTYYVIVTYTATSTESLVSQEFIVNVLPGTVPTVNVASAGAPTGATNFAAYASTYPGLEVLQQASKTTTALGTAFTLSYPLTNSQGVVGAATNVASNICGLALTDSNELFFSGTGGSVNVGSQSLLGATQSLPPLLPSEVQFMYTARLTNNAIVEMNLRNTIYWSPTLVGTQVGLYLDATTGFYVADTAQSNKVGYIFASSDGVPALQGQNGDLGKRVQVCFLPAATI